MMLNDPAAAGHLPAEIGIGECAERRQKCIEDGEDGEKLEQTLVERS